MLATDEKSRCGQRSCERPVVLSVVSQNQRKVRSSTVSASASWRAPGVNRVTGVGVDTTLLPQAASASSVVADNRPRRRRALPEACACGFMSEEYRRASQEALSKVSFKGSFKGSEILKREILIRVRGNAPFQVTFEGGSALEVRLFETREWKRSVSRTLTP